MITAKTKFRPTKYHNAKLVHMPLSNQEEKVVELLRHVESDSFWGIAIRDSFIDYSIEKMRELIASLLSQSDDQPDAMYRILGGKCYNELIELKG